MSKNSSITDLTLRNVAVMAQMEKAFYEGRTFGDRVADHVANTVGSWSFIIIQSAVLGAWMAVNLLGWFFQWDPYPFILLNLVLSFQAAYAGPIIMMSENRQAKLNERRNQLDLQINLLAEQENTEMLKLLRRLCEKLDVPTGRAGHEKALEEATCPEEVVRQIDEIAANLEKPKVS